MYYKCNCLKDFISCQTYLMSLGYLWRFSGTKIHIPSHFDTFDHKNNNNFRSESIIYAYDNKLTWSHDPAKRCLSDEPKNWKDFERELKLKRIIN